MPTWHYAAVHVYGAPHLVEGEATPAAALKNARYDKTTKIFSCGLDFSQGVVDLIVTECG